MGWHAWLTLIVLGLMLYALVRNLIPPDVAFMGGLVIVVATGVIEPETAFRGLSNHGMITVGAMFIVAAGLRETGALHVAVSRLLGATTGLRAVLARLMCPAAGLSAFVNNTPIVAMLLPEVVGWCRKRGVSASKLLIPLSYAAILGGMCTLIGTSTNLVINGMMDRAPGVEPMSMFELGKVGIPAAVIGISFILFAGHRLLPDRKELMDQLGETQREYIVEMTIQPGCSLIGKRIQDAGLRQLPGLFLIEIDRAGEVLSPVQPTEVLEEQDRLVFTGLVRTIVDLQRIPGLVPAEEMQYDLARARQRRRMCEAVVSGSFPELGKTIRNSDFRTRYDAVVVAVHRNGERLRKKIGDIVLRPGDTLLLQAGEHFERTFRGSTDFYLVSEVQDSAPVRHERAWLAIAVLLLLVALLTFELLSPAVAALLASGLMVLLRCAPVGVARRAVDWQVLVVIAAALGFGEAIKESGLASAMAELIVRVGRDYGGPIGVLIGIYVLTNVLTELVTHIGAAAIAFPIAIAAAESIGANGVDPRPFAITIAVAASASFATPIGYQTNLMVYGPGGYRFTDFLRVGLLMNLLIMIVAVLIIPQVWPF